MSCKISFSILIFSILVAVNFLYTDAYLKSPNKSYGGGSTINAAVQSRYNLEIRKVDTHQEPIPMQRVEIESNQIPLLLHFKTQSSKLKIVQTHTGSPGETQKSRSEDEPNILIHEVKKPVYQQVRETIVPYRKTIQEVKPVQEQMETIIAKGGGSGGKYGPMMYAPAHKSPKQQSQYHHHFYKSHLGQSTPFQANEIDQTYLGNSHSPQHHSPRSSPHPNMLPEASIKAMKTVDNSAPSTGSGGNDNALYTIDDENSN